MASLLLLRLRRKPLTLPAKTCMFWLQFNLNTLYFLLWPPQFFLSIRAFVHAVPRVGSSFPSWPLCFSSCITSSDQSSQTSLITVPSLGSPISFPSQKLSELPFHICLWDSLIMYTSVDINSVVYFVTPELLAQCLTQSNRSLLSKLNES